MIIIPNPSLLHSRRDHSISVRSEMEGRFTMHILKADADGKPIEASRREVADFPNLILDQGLDRVAAATDYLNACQVGSGSAAPVNGNTGLQARIAGTTTAGGAGTVVTMQPSSPFFSSVSRTYQFGVGVAAGNLSEVGIGWSTTGTTLFSRALIVNEGGTPITITVLSDEILEVTYTIRCYPVEADTPQVVNISGTNYTFTRRPGSVTSSGIWALGGGTSSLASAPRFGVSGAWAYSGGLGAITALPSGTAAASNTVTRGTYVAGSRASAATAVWPIASANFGAGGIQGMYLSTGGGVGHGAGAYQYGISPAIPKTGTQTLTIFATHSWGRRAI